MNGMDECQAPLLASEQTIDKQEGKKLLMETNQPETLLLNKQSSLHLTTSMDPVHLVSQIPDSFNKNTDEVLPAVSLNEPCSALEFAKSGDTLIIEPVREAKSNVVVEVADPYLSPSTLLESSHSFDAQNSPSNESDNSERALEELESRSNQPADASPLVLACHTEEKEATVTDISVTALKMPDIEKDLAHTEVPLLPEPEKNLSSAPLKETSASVSILAGMDTPLLTSESPQIVVTEASHEVCIQKSSSQPAEQPMEQEQVTCTTEEKQDDKEGVQTSSIEREEPAELQKQNYDGDTAEGKEDNPTIKKQRLGSKDSSSEPEHKLVDSALDSREMPQDTLSANGKVLIHIEKVVSDTESTPVRPMRRSAIKANAAINWLSSSNPSANAIPKKEPEDVVLRKVQLGLRGKPSFLGHKEFRCGECECSFETVEMLQDHLEVVHGKAEIKVFENNVKETSFCAVSFRKGLKSEEPINQCTVCDQLFFSRNNIHRHIREKHNMDANSSLIKPGRYIKPECKNCDIVLPAWSIWHKHNRQNHLAKKVQFRHRCEKCKIGYYRTRELDSHRKKYHSAGVVKRVAKNRQVNSCKACGYWSSHQRHVKRHIDIIHKVPYNSLMKLIPLPRTNLSKCAACNKTFPSAKLLSLHYKRVHISHEEAGPKPSKVGIKNSYNSEIKRFAVALRGNSFSCRICWKRFQNKANTKRHVRSVHGSMQVFCPTCKKEVTMLNHFRYHKIDEEDQSHEEPQEISSTGMQPEIKLVDVAESDIAQRDLYASTSNAANSVYNVSTDDENENEPGYSSDSSSSSDSSDDDYKNYMLSNSPKKEGDVSNLLVYGKNKSSIVASKKPMPIAVLKPFSDNQTDLRKQPSQQPGRDRAENHIPVVNQISSPRHEQRSLYKPFMCDYCSVDLKLADSYESHTKNRHFNCPFCGKVLESRDAHSNHITDVHDMTLCLACDVVGTESFIKQHVFDSHMNPQTGLFYCTKCVNGTAIYPLDIIDHISQHDQDIQAQCHLCLEALPNDIQQHNIHFLSHAAILPLYKCLACNAHYLEAWALRQHVTSSHECFCVHCLCCSDSASSYNSSHGSHVCSPSAVIHSEVMLKTSAQACQVCWINCDPGALRAHCLREHSQLRFHCLECGQRFGMKQELDFHTRMHRREKVLKYNVCPDCLLVEGGSKMSCAPCSQCEAKKQTCMINLNKALNSFKKRKSIKPPGASASEYPSSPIIPRRSNDQRNLSDPIASTSIASAQNITSPPIKKRKYQCSVCSFSCDFLAALNKHSTKKHGLTFVNI